MGKGPPRHRDAAVLGAPLQVHEVLVEHAVAPVIVQRWLPGVLAQGKKNADLLHEGLVLQVSAHLLKVGIAAEPRPHNGKCSWSADTGHRPFPEWGLVVVVWQCGSVRLDLGTIRWQQWHARTSPPAFEGQCSAAQRSRCDLPCSCKREGCTKQPPKDMGVGGESP
jgi:hypothetical protein